MLNLMPLLRCGKVIASMKRFSGVKSLPGSMLIEVIGLNGVFWVTAAGLCTDVEGREKRVRSKNASDY